jgi:hypothetical protein
MLYEKNVGAIVVLSFLLILWWRAVWSLLDVLFGKLAKGNKGLLITFDIASILLILVVLFTYPEVSETFH